MACTGKSLRSLVENWLAPAPGTSVRVTEFKRTRTQQGCYVRVEALRMAGSVEMFFFRHENGMWCVFPPRPSTPAINSPSV
jgi:hypothetical protein